MLEGGGHFLVRLGQREPGLDARELGAPGALGAGRALGMDDAVAGGHQVHRAGLDRREGAERVAMVDRAGIEIGHGGEVDVRMRAHVDAGAGVQPGRTHLVEEDEGPHHSPRPGRQRAVDLEAAQIMGGGGDDLREEFVGHDVLSSPDA